MVQPYTEYALSEDEMANWSRIAALRNAVNGELEQARAAKTIGKSLEAEVDLTVPAEDAFLAERTPAMLADLLIVSQVRVEVGSELTVAVRPASGSQVPALLEGTAHRGQRRPASRAVPALRRCGKEFLRFGVINAKRSTHLVGWS